MPKAQQVEFLLAGVRDTNGNELAAGLVYSYAAGTTTAKALYSASDKSTSHAQGVALDGNGRLQAWGDGAYKFVIKTAAGTTVYTFDNVLYGYDDGELKWGGTSAGTGNAQTVSISSVTALSNGLRITFIAGNSNSGAATLNVSSLGAVAITKIDGSTALSSGDIIAGDLLDVVYDSGGGGRFRIITPPLNRTFTWGGTSGGSANAQTITTSPVTASYVAGQKFEFIAGNTNTGATTLNVNSLGAKNVFNSRTGVALKGKEIFTGGLYAVVYDGTQFQLLNPSVFSSSSTYTPTLTPAGAMTYSSTSITKAKYWFEDKTCFYKLEITGTVGGTPNDHITVSLPATNNGENITAFGTILDNGVIVSAFGSFASVTAIDVYRYDNAVFTAGTVTFILEGSFEIA